MLELDVLLIIQIRFVLFVFLQSLPLFHLDFENPVLGFPSLCLFVSVLQGFLNFEVFGSDNFLGFAFIVRFGILGDWCGWNWIRLDLCLQSVVKLFLDDFDSLVLKLFDFLDLLSVFFFVFKVPFLFDSQHFGELFDLFHGLVVIALQMLDFDLV